MALDLVQGLFFLSSCRKNLMEFRQGLDKHFALTLMSWTLTGPPIMLMQIAAGCVAEKPCADDPKFWIHAFSFSVLISAEFSIHIFVLFFLEYVLKIQEIFNAFFCRMLTFYDARFLLETMLIFRRFFRADFPPDFLMIPPKFLMPVFDTPPISV